jgi:hypothetical protein
MNSQLSWKAIGVLGLLAAFLLVPQSGATPPSPRVNVQLVTDEAEAVLFILSAKQAGNTIKDEDWQRLFSSEGYVRLKKREISMKRSFQDAEFKSFVMSEELSTKSAALRNTLERWRKADMSGAARRALEYLPANATIFAKIYPVIKPRTNSFVFEAESDPAIFLYLDPALSKENFENTVAHELHHIGYSSACSNQASESSGNGSSKSVETVLEWVSAFGEGWAMLAAAGGPDVHPHEFSSAEDRARWDRDVANVNQDLQSVQTFFLDVLNQKLKTDEEIQQKAFSFFGVQGPWYTLGWKMAVTIEQEFGRSALIECICDRKRFLLKYNEAATQRNRASSGKLPTWSEDFLARIGATAPKPAAGGMQ